MKNKDVFTYKAETEFTDRPNGKIHPLLPDYEGDNCHVSFTFASEYKHPIFSFSVVLDLVNKYGGFKDFVEGRYNYSVIKCSTSEGWRWEVSQSTMRMATVYMTEKCARKVCDYLNTEGLI